MTTFAQLELPPALYPNFSYETSLDGVEYKINFRYSVRAACWYISFYSLDGTLLLSNCRVVPWLDMLIPYVDENLPSGILMLAPTSTEYPQSPVITLDNLSTDFQLFYLSVE